MPEDLPRVLEVEQASHLQPWTQAQFSQELESIYSRTELLFRGKQLTGYICFWVVAGEMQILNVSTAPAFRRQGVARRLLEYAFDLAKISLAQSAFLEVRISNHGAIALYRALGFVDDCIRPKYYSDGEDALLMSCPLDSVRSEEQK
ncbi:ribosomal protein S18-alanine N-acetyltransferase [Geopsychrobacter electrodiphilus]|uniref:ribosomal protein S18-alanine N-acetyltransferase n=1 Tax=Geopsychrobacter electrodiphilus TaxID=225196 RepID=UPI000365B49F|nr:ribosomal protein S18-alanine N-acetyltransferase [Geopsychrobacter electrodiphilus]